MKKSLFYLSLIASLCAGVAAHAEPYCREYTQTFTIGNKTQKGYGTACMQADGTWEIQTPAQLPSQVNAVPSTTTIVTAPQTERVTYIVREEPVFVRQPRSSLFVSVGDPYPYHYRRHYYPHRW